MAADHAAYAVDYLRNTESVLYAGRRLRNLIDAAPATREYAVTGLERAAQQHESGGADYRAFMFSELETASAEDKVMRERATEDALGSILADLQVANVLMAAGLAMGETGEKAEPRLLDDALLKLETTMRAVEQPLASPLTGGIQPGRFGFASLVTAPEVVESPDLPSAVETFKGRSEETLARLVNEAQGVATDAITALSKLDAAKVLEALSKLGDQVQEIGKIGRLVRHGVEKLQGAINALIGLLNSEALAGIKDQVEKMWNDVKEGKYVAQALEWVFGVKATRAYIAEILGSEDLKREALDEGTNDLDQLAITFEETMKMTQGIAAAVTLAGTVLSLTPLAGPELVLLAASAYVLILAAVVLIGMDYADSGRVLQSVRGVREIAASVRLA